VTRTDRILRRLTAAVEARRAQLDGAAGLRSVELAVRFHWQTGQPFEVLVRVEEAESCAAVDAGACVR
jgi:hypothetical protein